MAEAVQTDIEDETITAPQNVYETRVTSVEHFTDTLFRFRVTRPASFRFRSGEFVMIGLPSNERVTYRAYSIASPSWDEEIEFYSIKVADGALTSELQKIAVGDVIWMKQKSTGTLVLDALIPGKRLFMLSTGTGFAPFASLARDPECYEKFDSIVMTHTCRQAAELQYSHDVFDRTLADPLVGEEAQDALTLFGSCTQDEYEHKGRITHLIEDGSLFEKLDIEALNPETDRVMLCGSMAMIQDLKKIMEAIGFEEGSNAKPGTYVLERAFVD